ncbi:MAG: hypothetical protein K6F53_11350 [Lachnospiraceae bacterium]|nr:hypothetical protein [Lachnospiraceae bacterium]
MTDTYYLIDYENVGTNGLSGCDRLKDRDHIYLFYTDNAKNTSLDIFHDHGGAELIVNKVSAGKQSADMHIISFLGFLIGLHGQDGSYVIISNDTDFDKVLRYWKDSRNVSVKRARSIKYILNGKQADLRAGDVKKTSAKASEKTKSEDTAAAKESAGKKTAAAKEPAGKKAATGSKRTKATQDSAKDLPKPAGNVDEELKSALSEADFEEVVIDEVTAFVKSHYGEDEFLTKIHNDLRKKYDNYLDVYEIIKPILNRQQEKTAVTPAEEAPAAKSEETAKKAAGRRKTVKKPADAKDTAKEKEEKPSAPEEKKTRTGKSSADKGAAKTALNNEIQKTLSKAGIEAEISNEVAAMVVKNINEKAGKQTIYRTIISKYGRTKGLAVYKEIKDRLS